MGFPKILQDILQLLSHCDSCIFVGLNDQLRHVAGYINHHGVLLPRPDEAQVFVILDAVLNRDKVIGKRLPRNDIYTRFIVDL